jgi:SAF domain-containing protein
VSNSPPSVGTAYFPATDVTPNGHGPAPGSEQARLRGLPRRRRPAMIALAVAMAGAGVLVSAAVYQRANHQVSVVTVTAQVPAGAVITAADLGTASVTVGSGIQVIPAAQLRQVTGEVAAVALRPATLLAPADLTTAQPPGPGQVLVPAAIKPTDLPASGLSPGDQVLVMATPGDQGQPSSQAGSASLASPVTAVVAAVDLTPGQSGLDEVDLLVRSASGPAVAAQVSTGQFALVVTKRGG